jgi:hypothetical protein
MVLAGCAGSGGRRETGPEIRVELARQLLAVGERQQARVRTADGGELEAAPAASFRSSNPDVLAVDPGGQVTGRAPGVASVIAECAGASARRIVEVVGELVTTDLVGRLVAPGDASPRTVEIRVRGTRVATLADGTFRVEGLTVPAGAGIRLTASAQGEAGPLYAVLEDVRPTAGGVTDVGAVALRRGTYEERILNLDATGPEEDVVQELGPGHWSVIPVHEGLSGATYTAWNCHCAEDTCWMNSYEVESESIGSNYVSSYDQRGRTIHYGSPEAAYAAARRFEFDLDAAEGVAFRVPDRRREDNCGGISLRLEGGGP